MPRLPRDCDYTKLIHLLKEYRYEITRKSGSHIRLHSITYNHSITIPAHKPLKIGTLNAILNELSIVTVETKDTLISKLR